MYSENMQQIYRRITPMPKCDFKKVEITLRYGCSPVNLLHIFRTTFPKNTSRGLLLELHITLKRKNGFLGIWTIAPEENCPRLGLGLGLGIVLGLGAIFLGGNCPRTGFASGHRKIEDSI